MQQPWSGSAIHDTVAAIVRGGDYVIAVRESMLMRALRWIARRCDQLMQWVEQIPHGPLIAKVCAVVIIALVLLRIILANRLRDEHTRVRIARARGGAHADAWSAAQSLAAAGRYTDASHALYHAVLERLAVHDGLRLHSSKTSGDYVRELRRRGASTHSLFRAFSRRYDSLIYGRGECSADDYASLLAMVQSLFVTTRAA